MKYEVTELCPHCDRENTLVWNPDEDGYEIYCPNCGEKMMLCTACYDEQKERGKESFCDWTREGGCHRKRERRIKIKKEPGRLDRTIDEMVQVLVAQNFSVQTWWMFYGMYKVGFIDRDTWDRLYDRCNNWCYLSDDGTKALNWNFEVVGVMDSNGNWIKVENET